MIGSPGVLRWADDGRVLHGGGHMEKKLSGKSRGSWGEGHIEEKVNEKSCGC